MGACADWLHIEAEEDYQAARLFLGGVEAVYKKRVYRKSMRAMLAPIRKYTESGVRMHLQGRDGKLKWMTVIPVIAFGSYDHPEMKKVTGIKDYYRNNPMLCSMYVRLAQ